MTDNVIKWTGKTVVDLPAEKVLTSAIEEDLRLALVIGWTQDHELYTACTTSDLAEMLLVVELTRQRILNLSVDRDP